MNSQHSTKRFSWRDATLAAALTVVGIGGLTTIASDPCAIVRATRFMMPYSMSMLATDPDALAAYCASSQNVVTTGPIFMVTTGPIFMHILLCKTEACPLDLPVAIDPANSGTLINPSSISTTGRLWRMSAEY